MAELQAAVREHGGAAVIDLQGDVDGGAEAALDEAYAQGRGAGVVVLNFSGAEYVNSTGIALIVQLLSRARSDGVRLGAFGLTDHYRQIFEITRLSDFMTIAGSEDEAVSAGG
jgi:anti-anti-sigma factor